MKHLGSVFYALLLVLSAAVIGALIVYFRTKSDLAFAAVFVFFVLYLVHLVYGLTRGKKQRKTLEEERERFRRILRIENCRVVYITYLSDERHIDRPSELRRDYLIELYPAMAEEENLKRHLWYDLSQTEENRLDTLCFGKFRVPKSFLGEIAEKRIYIQAAFFDVAKENPQYRPVFEKNQIVLYGEDFPNIKEATV